MKNLLNLKGLCRSSQLALNPDGQTTVERRSRLMSIICLFLLTLGAGQMWGTGTATTVYYAINTSYTVKCNYAQCGDCNSGGQGWWGTVTMTKVSGKKYNGKDIYKAEFTDQYNGLACMQFQLYDGSTWQSQDEAFCNSWTGVDTYNGKLWDGDSWEAYRWDQIGFEDNASTNFISYYNGANRTWGVSRNSQAAYDLGTISTLYLKGFQTHMYQNADLISGDVKMYYQIHRQAVSDGDYTLYEQNNWSDWLVDTKENSGWKDGWRHPKFGHDNLNINLLSGLYSGKYVLRFFMKEEGSTSYLNNGDGSNYSLKWTIGVPAMATHTCTSDGSGNGSSETPFTKAVGSNLTITIAGTQSTRDDNSVLYVSFDGGSSYSTTTTHTINSITSTKQSLSIKAKYRNNTDDIDGTIYDFGTIYYQGTATPSLAISSFEQNESTVTAANSGSTVTIHASRENAGTAEITYEYSTSSTFASDVHTIASTISTSQSWTLPACTSTTTYYVRASMTYSATNYSDIESFKVYGKKTIKVKNTNGWSPFYMHRWGGDRADTGFPGEDDQISDYGTGQWKEVVLYSSNDNFIFVDGTNTSNKNSDQTYAGVTDGACYEIASGTGVVALNSTLNCPAKPSLTTTSTPSANNYTTATIAGNISSNGNDNITDYGFYWGTSATPGTKVQKGNSNYTGDISHDLTSLTPGTTYYYRAYAANGQGETLGTVYSFKSPYKVTISQSTGCSSISPSGTQYTSGSINLTADAATGYTFSAWEKTNGDLSSAATPSAGRNTVTFTPTSDNATITATYDEDMHAVDIVANDAYGNSHGSVSVDKVNVGIATVSEEITATPENKAWRFKHWVIAPGISAADGYDTHSNPLKINATSDDITLIAYFEPRYALMGSLAEDGDPAGGMPYPTWNDGAAADFEVFGFDAVDKEDGVDLRCTRTLEPNKTYKFQVYDREIKTLDAENYHTRLGLSSATVLPASDSRELTVVNGSGDVRIQTVGRGNYTFKITKLSSDATYNRPTITVERPSSHLVSIGQGYVDIDDVAHSNSTTGGTLSAEATESGTTIAITNGKYIANDGRVDWTVDPADGYTLDKYYGYADFSDGGFTFTYIDSVNAAVNVYAKFVETSTAVTISHNTHGHVTVGGVTATSTTVGITTTRALVAVPDAGYYFAGWTVPDGADFELQDKSETEDAEVTLHGLGAGTAGTLIANFVELDKIYFRNIFDDGAGNVSRWSNVYVYFDYSWDGDKVHTNSNAAYKVAMTRIGSTDVYYGYVPRAITTSGNKKVAFSDTDFTVNYTFYNVTASGSKGAVRSDYSPLLNMFVPYHTPNQTNNNGVDYYSNGYWMKYDTRASQGAGYYLKVYNSRNNYTEKGEFTANTDDATMIRFQVRVDNTNADKTRFMITSAGGLNYLAAATPTSTANSDIDLNEDTRTLTGNDVYFQLTATSEGFYTFILDQTGDKMKLTVDYPVSPGDYRLKHTYSGRNKANTADSTYITYSDVIKASTAGTAKTYSMYLNTGGEETLVLQKCERINNTTQLPEWSEGDATNLSAVLTKVRSDDNGVYQFDVTVSADKVNTVDAIKKYEGNYYIKTDCAPGGWVNYTQNAMEANTINATAAGYDYYFLKWIDNTETNVKCVIANDFNNELSDTLKSDAILTRNGEAYQTLPEAASVRFSYDSKTNTLKRTYLRGSTLSENFVTLVPNAAEYVYSAKTSGTDYYSSNPKFADNGNWTYQMDAWVYPGAKGGVQTSYPGVDPVTIQTLVPMDNDLMGGTKPVSDPVLYHVRLVYDFKTDYLMAAYIPDATTPITTEIDLQSDMMYVRSGVSNGTQLSFDENNGKLTHVRRAYAAIQLPKDEMVGQMTTWSANDYRAYKYCRYYISFPFDVNVRDIFGVGTFGNEYIIKMYNGAKRAQIGWFAETETFWETLTIDSVLHAYQGYCLMLDRNAFNDASNGVWTNIGTGGSTFLYFPSSSTAIGEINGNGGTIPVPTHTCTIDRTFGTPVKNHKNTDSNWNLMGFAPYANAKKTGETLAYYVYEPEGNSWTSANTSETNNFNSMHAYMVQWGGDFNYIQAPDVPSSVAARRVKAQKKNDFIRLELLYNGAKADHALIKMTDGADKDFVLNEDMGKIINSGKPNIYVYAGNYDVAFSQVPEESQTVQVGVVIRKNGTYTFSMPSNFDGTVTLIDNFTQTRTNLAIEDYEVSLPKGEINDRFLLEINIRQVPTAIDGVEGGSLKDGKAHKYIENGAMYILRDGKIYDARGNKVK